MRSVGLILVLVAVYFPTGGQGQEPAGPGSDSRLRQQAQLISAWGFVPEILEAVQERNANQVPTETIRAIDLDWIYATRETSRMRSLMSNPCGEKLKEFVAGNSSYREAMVMDDLGALVCMSSRTSDYWQGDEAKWTQAFKEGSGAVFIGEPAFDESVAAVVVQISVPILHEKRAIGVITVGLDYKALADERRP